MANYELLLDTTDLNGDRADAARLNLTLDVVQPNGPGGGWPEIRICGEEDHIMKFLEQHFDDDGDAKEYFETYADRIES